MAYFKKIGSKSFEMRESSIRKIDFLLLENKTFEVAIKLSDSAEASRLLAVLQQNRVSDIRQSDDKIKLSIGKTQHFNAQDIHSVLRDFSNQFGNNTIIDQEISTILTTRGRILEGYNASFGSVARDNIRYLQYLQIIANANDDSLRSNDIPLPQEGGYLMYQI